MMKCRKCGHAIEGENVRFCDNCGAEVADVNAIKAPKIPKKQNTIIAAWPEWSVEQQLGRGSYGTVYKAVRRDFAVESHSAIKVIPIPTNQSEIDSLRSDGLDVNGTKTYLKGIVDDFVGEISLMESLKGVQNIVSVEDYKVVEKTDEIGWDIYIRMELLTPFNTYLRENNNRLDEKEIIRLGADICSALEICAKRNIIHRDVKPENIFINDFGHFKLGDFGIARKLENATGGLSQKGTLNYMAPEVSYGRDYDERADIYSLGVVLYKLLNENRLPFIESDAQLLNPNERRAAVERRIKGETLPKPKCASPETADVILRACAYDPKDRFASAKEFKEALLAVKLCEHANSAGDFAVVDEKNAADFEPNENSSLSFASSNGKSSNAAFNVLSVENADATFALHSIDAVHNVVKPQAEEKPAEEAKVEEIKIEDAKAEESKTVEPKPEAPKDEEPIVNTIDPDVAKKTAANEATKVETPSPEPRKKESPDSENAVCPAKKAPSKSKKKKGSAWVIVAILLIIALLSTSCLITTIIVIGLGSGSGEDDDIITDYWGESEYTSPENLEEIAFETITVSNGDVFTGPLAPGTEDSFANSEDILNIYTNRTSGSYGLSHIGLGIQRDALYGFDSWITDYVVSNGDNGLCITEAYEEYTPQTYASSAEYYAAVELASGFAIKLSLFKSGVSFSDSEFDPLWESAYRYGIIQRFPGDKSWKTGLDAPNYYRYVGLPHSEYMKEHGFCLEEYIEHIKQNGEITFDSSVVENTRYFVYYVPAELWETGSGTTDVKVPAGNEYSYTISGDGINGFIVTVTTTAN